MKIGIIQQHNTADRDDNKRRLAEKVRKLAEQGAELIVMQELHNGLYFCQTEDVNVFDQAEPIPGPSTEFFGALAKELQVVIVTSLFERRAPGLYHNTAVVLEKDGTIAGKYRKMHIPDDPGYYEKFYFTPGDLGFKPIQTSVGRLGVLVCWDQWYPEAARLMALAGAQLLIYPTAIGYDPHDNAAEQQCQQCDQKCMFHIVCSCLYCQSQSGVAHDAHHRAPDHCGFEGGAPWIGGVYDRHRLLVIRQVLATDV